MANGNVKTGKKRHWVFILYPESAPGDWFERLQASGLRGEVSPLHDKDVNLEIDPETGKPELKKPHYHVLICYDGPTTYSVVKAFTDTLNAARPEPCNSVRGSDRYWTHMDNPEKYQYDRADIRPFGGFCISDYVERTASEKQALRVKVMGIIREANIDEYSDLLDMLMDSDMADELETAMSNTLLYRGYIESRRCGPARRRAQGSKVISLADRREGR